MAQPAAVGSSVNKDLGYKLDHKVSIASIIGNDTTEGTGVAVDLRHLGRNLVRPTLDLGH